METKNPFQQPRLAEIRTGKKFWGYLDTEAMQTRYVLAAHFLKQVKHIVEVGSYRQNAITHFLTQPYESVTVYSLDAEFEALERDTLNGSPCRVRHVKDFFQGHVHPRDSLGLVALGLEIFGDPDPFYDLVRSAHIEVLEIPVEHQPSVDCFEAIRQNVEGRLRCQIDLDLSPNAAIVAEELAATNMNRPFWRRNVYVLEPVAGGGRGG